MISKSKCKNIFCSFFYEWIEINDRIRGFYFFSIFLGSTILMSAKSNYIKERKKAIQSDKLKSAFLANMSHEIRFGYHIETPLVRFYVRDTGPGIRKEFQNEIFDRFHKLDTDQAHKIPRGAGIGLSISKNLVQLLGGDLWVESDWGKGTTFYFTIQYEPAENITTFDPTLLQAFEDSSGKKRIMVVEDEVTNFQCTN